MGGHNPAPLVRPSAGPIGRAEGVRVEYVRRLLAVDQDFDFRPVFERFDHIHKSRVDALGLEAPGFGDDIDANGFHQVQGTRTILPIFRSFKTASWARGASARGISSAMTGLSVPLSRPACKWAWMTLSSSGSALNKEKPRISALRPIMARGSISTRPRLPMTMIRPCMDRPLRSLSKFTLASISRITSRPCPWVADTILSK